MQRKWYRSILEKDIDAVNGKFHRFSWKGAFSEVHLRFDWQEGRQNPTYEYGHAGVCVPFFAPCLLYYISLASQSDVPPIPLWWSSKSRIFVFGLCSYRARNLDHLIQLTNIWFKILAKWLSLINYSRAWKKRAPVYWFLVKWVEFSTFSRTIVYSGSTVRYPLMSLTNFTKILSLRRILSNWRRYCSRGSYRCHWRVQ